MFYTLSELSFVLELVHLVGFVYPKCDPRPLLAMDEAMEKAMLNYGSNVCDNDSMIMFEDCPNNELLELLKTKKHARMFVHMLKYFENKNHILHNSPCESNSLIEKYKRRMGSRKNFQLLKLLNKLGWLRGRIG